MKATANPNSNSTRGRLFQCVVPNRRNLDLEVFPGGNGSSQRLSVERSPASLLTAIFLSTVCLGSFAGAAQSAPGDLDSSFNPQANDLIYAVAVTQPGDKVIVAGAFTTIDGVSRDHIARLNSNGTVDSSLFANSGADDTVRTLVVQPDGRILAGGDFTSISGMNWGRIGRLNSDGTVDSTFSQLTGANNRVYAVALEGNQILIGGDFTRVNNLARNYLARLNSDGAVDAGFAPNFNGTVYAIAVLPDNRILVGGDFTTVNNQPLKYLARLNANGTLDPTFNQTADSDVYCIVIQTDGKAVIGGNFGHIGSATHNGLARFNSDGTLDSFFTAGMSGTAYSLALQSDGKLLVAGRFSVVNNITRNNLARLNTNGSLDASFDSFGGASYTIRSVALQSDGKISIGGEFTLVNGFDHRYLARFNGNPPANSEEIHVEIERAVRLFWNSKTNVQYQVQYASPLDTNRWNILDGPIAGNGSTNVFFDPATTPGSKFYRVIELP
jgi:uncharacterized delta-60 repeat protein